MNDPVLNSVDRLLADIDADDAHQAAVSALAEAIQGDIEVVMGGEAYRGKAAWLNGKACVDTAIENFDVTGNSIHALLLAIGAGASTESAIADIQRELKALAYEASTVRAERIIADQEQCR